MLIYVSIVVIIGLMQSFTLAANNNGDHMLCSFCVPHTYKCYF